jgi:1,4-dihydroxy-2-naphthoate polyprenyltransferase
LTLSSFFQFVELQTKLASMMPFFMGTLFAVYRYNSFKLENFLIMLTAVLTFDMATTAINNYLDYKKAVKTEGYNYESKNAIVSYGIKESTALIIIFSLLFIAVTFGIILTVKTNILVLLLGVFSFAVGILYTFGPIPISRTPFGEIFSGIFMGLIITFLSIYVNVFDLGVAAIELHNYIININLDIKELAVILLISVPLITGIANIMLANNICDVEEDIVNKRYTLPYYLGRKISLKIFAAMYYIPYATIALSVALRLLPALVLLSLVTIIPVNKNINTFCANPVKGETFVLSVKNFVLLILSQIVLLGIVLVINTL